MCCPIILPSGQHYFAQMSISSDELTSVRSLSSICLVDHESGCHITQVWDRRCIAATGNPAGFLEGHLEGITFIDSRGDGHYFISNSKDQTTKLWDIRRMSSTTKSYVLLPVMNNFSFYLTILQLVIY